MRTRNAVFLAALAGTACTFACAADDDGNSLLGGYGTGRSSSSGSGGTHNAAPTSSSGSGSSSSGSGSSSGSSTPPVTVQDGGAVLQLQDGGTETAEDLFQALLPQFQSTCGNACHALGGSGAPTYLAPPDAYTSIKAFPGIVVATPAQSIVLTKGQHEGPNLVDPLRTQITQWLTVEAAGIAAAGPAETPALTPNMGANTVDLSALGVKGASLSFSAATSGNILTLSSLELAAPATTGVAVTFPILYINPAGGGGQLEDDDLSNVAQTVPAGTSAALGTGILVIPGWATGDTLQFAMTKIAAASASDAGTTGGCKSVATFTSDAVPAITSNQCLNCHNTGGSGNASLDLSGLKDNPVNDTAACAQALTRINTANPAQSDIILAPTGQVANHPFTQATQAYVTAMETWIAAEK